MQKMCVGANEVGLNPNKLCEMIDALEKDAELHSIAVYCDGKKVMGGAWKPFTEEDPQMMHSLSKIGTAICIGFAVDEGKLHLEDKILNYIREELPEEYDDSLEDLTIYHLLTMQAGSLECCNNVWFSRLESAWETQWLKEAKIKEDIGKVFHYDSGCSYTLSRIVTKVMEKNCLSIMQERVFSKMGMGKINWLVSPEGHNTGGWGMYLTAEQIVMLAQLISQHGVWNGEQLVPAWWVEEMSKPRVSIPGAESAALNSYAYHMKAGEEIFAAEGAFGQYLICFRACPIAIGITAGTPNYVAADICLKYLKEAMEITCESDEVEQAEKRLCEKMSSLKLPLPAGDMSQTTEEWQGWMNKPIIFTENPRKIQRAIFTQNENKLDMKLVIADEEKTCTAGFMTWIRNDLYPGDFRQEYHSISYAFNENELHICVGLINTSYREEYCFRAEGYNLVGTWKPNVTYLPQKVDNLWTFTGTVV